MKDNFSRQSRLYAQFRPTYPEELFNFILSFVDERKTAWDCGTGNGQVAVMLSRYFEKVCATDVSENQIENAIGMENVLYKVESAENTSFSDNSFDLITVAQALHWFDFDQFYKEVNRTLKPNGVLAAFAYSLPTVDKETDEIVDHFYENIMGPYWDEERKYVDEQYRTIPFPFQEIEAPAFKAQARWDFDQSIGFLNTWSAVQHYKERNNGDPVDMVVDDLRKCWRMGQTKTVTFPIFLRIGQKKDSITATPNVFGRQISN